MKTRKFFLRITAVSCAAFLFLSMMRGEEVSSRTAAEPDLFPFITSQGSVQPDGGIEVSHEAQIVNEKPNANAALSSGPRDALPAPMNVSTLEEAVQKMRGQGASDDEIYRMRAAALSPEAAARLAAMDQEQAAWKARIDSYLVERSKLLDGSGNISGAAQQEALQRLRQTRFAPAEQQQLTAYESGEVPQLRLD